MMFIAEFTNNTKLLPKMIYEDALKKLHTELIFVLFPFIILFFMYFIDGKSEKIIFSNEWSLSACLILCQAQGKLIANGINSKLKQNLDSHLLFHSIRFVFIAVALLTYVKANNLATPNIKIVILQFIEFFVAIFFHYRDGLASLMKIEK